MQHLVGTLCADSSTMWDIVLIFSIARAIMIMISVAFIPASTIIVVIIVSNNGIDDNYGNASCQDTEHVKHDGADTAAQGHAMESLGCALLLSRVTQTVSLYGDMCQCTGNKVPSTTAVV